MINNIYTIRTRYLIIYNNITTHYSIFWKNVKFDQVNSWYNYYDEQKFIYKFFQIKIFNIFENWSFQWLLNTRNLDSQYIIKSWWCRLSILDNYLLKYKIIISINQIEKLSFKRVLCSIQNTVKIPFINLNHYTNFSVSNFIF